MVAQCEDQRLVAHTAVNGGVRLKGGQVAYLGNGVVVVWDSARGLVEVVYER